MLRDGVLELKKRGGDESPPRLKYDDNFFDIGSPLSSDQDEQIACLTIPVVPEQVARIGSEISVERRPSVTIISVPTRSVWAHV